MENLPNKYHNPINTIILPNNGVINGNKGRTYDKSGAKW